MPIKSNVKQILKWYFFGDQLEYHACRHAVADCLALPPWRRCRRWLTSEVIFFYSLSRHPFLWLYRVCEWFDWRSSEWSEATGMPLGSPRESSGILGNPRESSGILGNPRECLGNASGVLGSIIPRSFSNGLGPKKRNLTWQNCNNYSTKISAPHKNAKTRTVGENCWNACARPAGANFPIFNDFVD